jgi:hypothetical protein
MIPHFELPVSVEELRASGFGDDKVRRFAKGFQRLVSAGLPPEDLADVFYSDPRLSTALENGNEPNAKAITATRIAESLIAIERTGISEAKLWRLTEAGLAVGEIAWAIRNIAGFKQDMLTGNAEKVNERANSTYEFFRSSRTTRRAARTTRSRSGRAESLDSGAGPASWFGHYWKIVRQFRVDRDNMPESLANTSVFGALADPNLDLFEEMQKEARVQQQELEERMRNPPAAGAKNNESSFWIVLFLVIVGVIILAALLSTH